MIDLVEKEEARVLCLDIGRSSKSRLASSSPSAKDGGSDSSSMGISMALVLIRILLSRSKEPFKASSMIRAKQGFRFFYLPENVKYKRFII